MQCHPIVGSVAVILGMVTASRAREVIGFRLLITLRLSVGFLPSHPDCYWSYRFCPKGRNILNRERNMEQQEKGGEGKKEEQGNIQGNRRGSQEGAL